MLVKHAELTEKIIAAFYVVYNTLGTGFLEKVYRNALALELAKRGLDAQIEVPIRVYYDGVEVGEYFADLVVQKCVLVELKAVEKVSGEHEAQLLHYLRATDYEVGLLLNFGPEPLVRRKVLDAARKKPRGAIVPNKTGQVQN
jgi:GxxExxY protein